jgi:cobalt/nickel transport system permease protein
MHIPDGYLGPITYIAMFIIMIPIWIYAGRKVQKELKSRQVPLLALGAAFSFIIMMFNFPIPGGSTGHAVGAAIIAIVLGPWATVICVSVALVIQAFLFGDGGITCIGANCFNMAVVIPFTAIFVYKLISGKVEIKSTRRLVAAVIAGYIGLTVAAGVAGFEMGMQPILEHDANGTPLYMPYGLNVTLPAMISEHLILYSFIEAIATGLIFAYLQRSNPELLMGTSSLEMTKAKPANTATA